MNHTRHGRKHRRGLWAACVAFLCMAGAAAAHAYSYAAAGAEPLIDAREATLAALEKGDIDAARKATEAAQEELAYLDANYGTQLRGELDAALESRDADRVDRVFRNGFEVEVRRRITAAGEAISDYQRAKVLVVKSKRFVDLLAPHLDAPARETALKSLEACLEAVGNPGVFGVGATPADPEAFRAAAAELLRSISAP